MTEHESIDENPLDALVEDFVGRYRLGERPGLSEYIARNPELADEIRDLFPALLMMEDARPPAARPPVDSLGVHGTTGAKRIERLGDYRILRELGRGGMGIVYEAEQESLGRHVALKVLPRHSLLDPRYLQRFEREARAAARLHHTNIVPVFGIGEQDGLHYYVMQYIQGQGLDSVLSDLKHVRTGAAGGKDPQAKTGPLLGRGRTWQPTPVDVAAVTIAEALASDCPAPTADRDAQSAPRSGSDSTLPVRPVLDNSSSGVQLPGPEQHASLSDSGRNFWHGVARVGVQVADALAYAHSRGVLHRDIKPSNLLLDTQGTVWVTDFGLAKATDSHDLTQTGDIVGTLRYLAPERLQGRSDQRSDIYSLGATLYELLTLRPPFEDGDQKALVRQIMHAEPLRLGTLDADIPRDLETVIHKAIAKDPRDRYASPLELADDLRRFLADRPIIARRPALWERAWRLSRRNPLTVSLIGALLVALLAGLAGVTWKWREAAQARESERLARRDADDQARANRQGLRDLQEAHKLLDQGRFRVDLSRWNDAERMFSQAIQARPDYGYAWDARGHLYARLGLFDLAAADFERAFELQEPVVSWRWFAHAVLRRHVGDAEGYQHACVQMRQRYQRSSGSVEAIELLRTWVLAPQSTQDLEPLLEAGESVLVGHPDAWCYYVVGVAHYRLEHDDRAVQRLHESLTVDPAWNARGIAYPVLAMAYHRQGNVARSRQALRDAEQSLEQWTQQLYGPRDANRWPIHQGAEGVWPIDTWDWVEFHLNYREAKRLIEGVPPATDPRLLVWRARAFAALRHRTTADTEYDAALAVSPRDPLIRFEKYRNRGYLRASESLWDEAAVEFGRARELAPSEAQLWSFQATACLAAGNQKAYRRVCAAMFEAFRESQDQRTAHLVVFACVSLPDVLNDMRDLVPLARFAAPWHHGNVRVLGAAHYRAGDHAAAVTCLEESARVYHPRAWELCFLAMAYERSGRLQEARECLARAHRWIDNANRGAVDDVSGIQRYFDLWEEHIQFPTLLKEADELINRSPAQHAAEIVPLLEHARANPSTNRDREFIENMAPFASARRAPRRDAATTRRETDGTDRFRTGHWHGTAGASIMESGADGDRVAGLHRRWLQGERRAAPTGYGTRLGAGAR